MIRLQLTVLRSFAALVFLACAAARADISFHVDIDTSILQGNAGGPYQLAFQLVDGSGSNDANNSAVLSGFNFAGGAVSAPPSLSGGAAGNLATSATLTDSSFFNAIVQSFSPGGHLRFDVTLGTAIDAGATPDEFSLAILDGQGNEIPTTDPAGAFIVLDLDSAQPRVQTFAAAGGYSAMGAPIVTLNPAVPEPGSSALLTLGLGAIAFLQWRRRRQFAARVDAAPAAAAAATVTSAARHESSQARALSGGLRSR